MFAELRASREYSVRDGNPVDDLETPSYCRAEMLSGYFSGHHAGIPLHHQAFVK